MGTRRLLPGSAPLPDTEHARWASSTSAKRARSPSSIGTMASTPMPSSRQHRRLRLAARSAISRHYLDLRLYLHHAEQHRRDAENDDPDNDRADDDGDRVDHSLVRRGFHQSGNARVQQIEAV